MRPRCTVLPMNYCPNHTENSINFAIQGTCIRGKGQAYQLSEPTETSIAKGKPVKIIPRIFQSLHLVACTEYSEKPWSGWYKGK